MVSPYTLPLMTGVRAAIPTERMTPPSPQNLATDANCVDLTRIRHFLALLRHQLDDNIAANINDSPDCLAYFNTTVRAEWQNRRQLIDYCANYEAKLRKTAEETVKFPEVTISNEDLKKDPYAMKKVINDMEAQFATCDAIKLWVHTEQGVEKIVEEQTIKVFERKCGFYDYQR